MTTVITRTFLDFVEQELKVQLMRFSKKDIKEDKASELASELASKMDWNNSALMHKGISWMAKNYLEQIEA